MGTFEKCLEHLWRPEVEGGYVNDPDDAGGETYRGISRVNWPNWPGWGYIDQIREHGMGKKEIEASGDLSLLAARFYREQFWDRVAGDRLPPEVAAEVFDSAVNAGTHRAVLWLQQALNLLNRNGKDYPDVAEDGRMGQGTINALAAYLKRDTTTPLLKVLNVLQGAHYIEYMRKSPTQEKYARGWLTRVALPPTA
ncbi:MAG: glycoside hydrolase family 108 protein [Thermodesulfobacteriota bacterium]